MGSSVPETLRSAVARALEHDRQIRLSLEKTPGGQRLMVDASQPSPYKDAHGSGQEVKLTVGPLNGSGEISPLFSGTVRVTRDGAIHLDAFVKGFEQAKASAAVPVC